MISKTLIILPGWGGSHKTWADFVDLAREEFVDVQVIDLPCFGGEPCPSEVWGVEEYAKFAKKQIVQSTNNPIILLGHSFGGQVATYLVANNPDICEKLILTGAAVYRPKNTLKRVFFGTIATLGKWIFKLPIIYKYDRFAKKILYKTADSPDYDNTSGIQQKIFKKVIRQDVSHVLPNMLVPTCVIWGEQDSYTPLRYGRKMAHTIPNAQLHIIEKGTHGLHHLKSRETLLQIIKNFVQ